MNATKVCENEACRKEFAAKRSARYCSKDCNIKVWKADNIELWRAYKRAWQRDWRLRNKEKVRADYKEYARKNREKLRVSWREYGKRQRALAKIGKQVLASLSLAEKELLK